MALVKRNLLELVPSSFMTCRLKANSFSSSSIAEKRHPLSSSSNNACDCVCRVDAKMMRPSGRYFGMMSWPISDVRLSVITRTSSPVSNVYCQMFQVATWSSSSTFGSKGVRMAEQQAAAVVVDFNIANGAHALGNVSGDVDGLRQRRRAITKVEVSAKIKRDLLAQVLLLEYAVVVRRNRRLDVGDRKIDDDRIGSWPVPIWTPSPLLQAAIRCTPSTTRPSWSPYRRFLC